MVPGESLLQDESQARRTFSRFATRVKLTPLFSKFYMWKPAKMVDGVRTPPNNWRTCFGGSVWEWDELTEEVCFPSLAPEPLVAGADLARPYSTSFTTSALSSPTSTGRTPELVEPLTTTLSSSGLRRGLMDSGLTPCVFLFVRRLLPCSWSICAGQHVLEAPRLPRRARR